jgi:hypothetical protein
MVAVERAEPGPGLGSEAAQHAAFLAFFRATVVEKVRGLPERELTRSRLPSGWTPLELLWHLAFMERRWFVWGFLGEPVGDPWGDSGGSPDGRWRVPDDMSLDDVVSRMEETAAVTEHVLTTTGLAQPARIGGRFEDDPPDLRWICFHVLQEYARHAGHLDVAVELAGGQMGE